MLLCAALVVAASRTKPARRILHIPVWTTSSKPLKAADLKAAVNGKPVKILRLEGPNSGLMLLLVLDLTADINEIDLARAALISTLAKLPPTVYVGVLRAQDGLKVLLDPTPDRQAIAKVIRSFPVSGTPGLLETVQTAEQLADSILKNTPVRVAICYISDSNIYDYREDFTNPVINYSDRRDLSRRFPEGLVRERISKINANLSYHQTPIFIIHLEYRTDRLNEAYQDGLLQLSSTTGGESVFCHSNTEIASAIGNMFQRIVSHYLLDLQLPPRAKDKVTISVRANDGSLTYRDHIYVKKK